MLASQTEIEKEVQNDIYDENQDQNFNYEMLFNKQYFEEEEEHLSDKDINN